MQLIGGGRLDLHPACCGAFAVQRPVDGRVLNDARVFRQRVAATGGHRVVAIDPLHPPELNGRRDAGVLRRPTIRAAVGGAVDRAAASDGPTVILILKTQAVITPLDAGLLIRAGGRELLLQAVLPVVVAAHPRRHLPARTAILALDDQIPGLAAVADRIGGARHRPGGHVIRQGGPIAVEIPAPIGGARDQVIGAPEQHHRGAGRDPGRAQPGQVGHRGGLGVGRVVADSLPAVDVGPVPTGAAILGQPRVAILAAGPAAVGVGARDPDLPACGLQHLGPGDAAVGRAVDAAVVRRVRGRAAFGVPVGAARRKADLAGGPGHGIEMKRHPRLDGRCSENALPAVGADVRRGRSGPHRRRRSRDGRDAHQLRTGG